MLLESSQDHGGSINIDVIGKMRGLVPGAQLYAWRDKTGDFADAIALRPQRFKHRLDPASIAFAAMAIGLEPLAQLLLVRIEDAAARYPLRVSGFGHLPVFEPLGGCVTRDAQAPAGLAHRHVLPQHEAA